MGNIALIKVPGASAATGLGKLSRDPLLKHANGGGLFGFDLSMDWSYDESTAPATDKVINNLATAWNATDQEIATEAGNLQVSAGQALAYAGGGLDFTGVTSDGCCVRGALGALADLQAAQQFCVIGWYKFPTEADWNKGGTIAPIFTASGPNAYIGGPDLVTIAQDDAPSLTARRQTNGGSTVETLDISNLTSFYGQVTQIMYARTASQSYFRLKSTLGEVTVTGPAGALNTGDLTALRPQWGVVEGLNNLVNGTSYLEHRAATSYRLYRGYVENLAASGRSPITLADTDWDLVQEINSYS